MTTCGFSTGGKRESGYVKAPDNGTTLEQHVQLRAQRISWNRAQFWHS
jgi:hypothetical protein